MCEAAKPSDCELAQAVWRHGLLVTNWHARKMFSDLLAHLFNPAEVHNMSLATKHARVYKYHRSDHFADNSVVQKQVDMSAALMAIARKKPELHATPIVRLMLEFSKV